VLAGRPGSAGSYEAEAHAVAERLRGLTPSQTGRGEAIHAVLGVDEACWRACHGATWRVERAYLRGKFDNIRYALYGVHFLHMPILATGERLAKVLGRCRYL
jgi:hypothetical protein